MRDASSQPVSPRIRAIARPAPLMVAPPRGNGHDDFDCVVAYADYVVPAVDHDVGLAAEQVEVVAYFQRYGSVGAQHNVVLVQRLDADAHRAAEIGAHTSSSNALSAILSSLLSKIPEC